MTVDVEEARRCVESALDAREIPGRVSVESDETSVTVIVAESPFVHHGMRFKRIVPFHFTLELLSDGAVRTTWGDHEWDAGELCKTEKGAAMHDALEPAVAWIREAIASCIRLP